MRSGEPGNEPRKALQLAGLALVNASVSQSLGLPATKPTPQKTSKATLPAGIPSHWGPGLALERADGRAAATLASARQSVGRAGTRPVQRPPPSRRATGHDSTRAARRSQYRTGSASPDLGSRERPACRCCRCPLLAAPPRFPGNELVVARRLGSFASLELPLAVFARAVPGLLPRQKLGEHVRLSAPSWQARIALSSVAGFSVSTVQLHARACVLRSRALHIYCARSRHTSSVACRPDRLAQRDARAGAS